jgi:hypothetical protein
MQISRQSDFDLRFYSIRSKSDRLLGGRFDDRQFAVFIAQFERT